jgi:hypothetical protein
MRRLRIGLFLWVAMVSLTGAGPASATDWGRFYHYPYSYFPQNYRRPYRSQDFNTPHGYPMHPTYMAFPPYFRSDLYYPYHRHMRPGNNPRYYYQGNHYILDVF